MPDLTPYAEAKLAALRDVLSADERVVTFGAGFGGISPMQPAFGALRREFPDQVYVAPTSELGVAGAAIGAALDGMRPIVGVSTSSFYLQGFAQLINEAANVRYMTNGASSCPVVFHMLGGIRRAGGPQHSHRLQSMFWNTPGLEVYLPASPTDVHDLLRHAVLESDDPTCFIDHPLLIERTDYGEMPSVPVGSARVLRDGADVTIVATSIMVPRAMVAARRLADQGIEATVVDPRTIVPFDEETIVAAVERTGRVVVVDEGSRSAGVAAELVTRIVERCYGSLVAAPVRVCTPDTPIPFSPGLEPHLEVTDELIAEAAMSLR